MEPTPGRTSITHATVHHRAKLLLLVGLAAFVGGGSARAPSAPAPSYKRHTREHFREAMPATVRADHPAIVPLTAAIRTLTDDPLQQIVVVNDVTHLLVDYDDDKRVYGRAEFHATFEEMLARRRQAGWIYLRDDCDGRAVFAAHLLSALGISWRMEASYWKEHAWIVARVNGVEYDLLDLRKDAPEISRVTYKLLGRWFVRPTHRPPSFAWRRAWAERTGRDLDLGLRLGMLTLDSTSNRMRERYATDWSSRVPHGRLSPLEDRVLTASAAGFPFGEPLQVGALASVTPTGTSRTTGTALGGAMGSATNPVEAAASKPPAD